MLGAVATRLEAIAFVFMMLATLLPLAALSSQVQLVLSFLDAKSLGRCECAWPSFLAAADASKACCDVGSSC